MSIVRPIEWALTIVKTVKKIGYPGLEAFTLSRGDVKFLMEEGDSFEQTLQEEASVCWNGQKYFMMWLNDSELEEYDVISEMDDINSFDFDLPVGVYYLDYRGVEDHHFLWIVTENNITYAGTYGGVCSVTVSKYLDKREYYESFRNAMHGSVKDYINVFSLEEQKYSVKFRGLEIHRSLNYG